ncbi:MAG: type I 3-dehydroquinate dehydratase [Deltaproteobacteria bacterium]|jgi:3-dehydroquinate dehydratase type I|nr:type I 3-dehydroquinate dehydratase [Deltaproteobacteria bacterium]
MKPRVCLSTGNTGLNGVYAAIDYAKSECAEFVELRFDMIAETAQSNNSCDNFDKSGILSEIKKIISYAKDKGIKIIGTNRDASYGSNRCVSFLGKQRISEPETPEKLIKYGAKEKGEPERIKFLRSVIELGIDICDIELDILEKNIIKDFVDFAHSKNSKIILSVHDFKMSVNLLDTIKYYIDSSYFGADYFKLTDTAVSEEDVVSSSEKNIKIRSIQTTDETAFPKFIIFSMGEKGRTTRASSIIYGSYFAYCSSPFGITATGQMPPDEFYKTVDFLGAS